MPGPVIVFEGRNEFEAQMARDTLQSGMIPVIHVPGVSAGIFGQGQTVRVAVPEDRVDEAVAVLREAGFEADSRDRRRGVDSINDAVGRALPRPLATLLFVLFAASLIMGILLVWLGRSGN